MTEKDIRRARHKAMSPPAPLLYAAFAMVALTIGLAAAWRYWLDPGEGETGVTVVSTQAFDFVPVGSEDGLEVRVMPEGRALTVVDGTLSSFLQGMVRSLDRQRRVDQVGEGAPYHVTLWSDGRLTLDDPTTDTSIPLQAYGVDNTARVYDLLTMAGAEDDSGSAPGAASPAPAAEP
ncbi:photosynthetic complex assembly protein PuhC [Roseospira visakhapatnamensis]|uniref:Putative photosynthetic complex assembly protein n=1 Tax=Roseospira visakhapatnamensis TaxID=390880 RepID=A0A7W6REQ7_9PROT|nr:photosynthetic complex assembly protein PuhC [Roseospira visakhapatnamensis]MBB4267190.1 putative photosynthetic complex assembly protein [Roseospira visakhapatnamensis]